MKMQVDRCWNWSSVNRPRVSVYWLDERHVGFGLSWGNGNSDPVWSIGLSGIPVRRLRRRARLRPGEVPLLVSTSPDAREPLAITPVTSLGRMVAIYETTECCVCSNGRGVAAGVDPSVPECVYCHHVCAHPGLPFRWAGAR